MSRGLIDRESFGKLKPAAQENLLRQTLLLYLTALELANHNPDEWEATAFAAALDHLAAKAPLRAYDEVERMLLPVSQRPALRKTTSLLRVEANGNGATSQEKLDRSGMRRRLLQLSAIQLPLLDRADAKRSVVARARRRYAATSQGEEAGD